MMMSALKIRSQLYHNRDLEMTTKTAVIIPYLVRSQDRQLSDGFSKKNSEGASALVEIQVRWRFYSYRTTKVWRADSSTMFYSREYGVCLAEASKNRSFLFARIHYLLF